MICLCSWLHNKKKANKKPWYRVSPPGATVGNDAYSRLSGWVRDVIAPPENGHTGALGRKGLNQAGRGNDTIG